MKVHYRIHKLDRKLWGKPTICGAKMGAMSLTLDTVTCKKCIRHTQWSFEEHSICRAESLTL